jgi:hypothetical protein
MAQGALWAFEIPIHEERIGSAFFSDDLVGMLDTGGVEFTFSSAN